ncbi:uncharacterized protein LOC142665315 isoform X2 [Rhinoderma darwinii]
MFGDDGGLVEYRSSLLASRGFASLTLPYFAFEDLPPAMTEFHLEYFEEAATFLSRHPKKMSDDFSLGDALSGQGNTGSQQSQGQNLNNPWGGQNPGQQYPGGGFPGQQYPGFPGPAQGQQYPGFPGPAQGQQYPGFPGPAQGQQQPGFPGPAQGQQQPGFPGPAQGQQQPGFPGPAQGQQQPGFPAGGQQYPGFPSAGQQFPGFPGFPGPGQTYPGAPTPGQGTTDPKQTVPSAPTGPMRVPCELPLLSGLTPRMMVTVNGIPNGKRFSIDFKDGSDIAFHLNPRFDEKPNVVVRNSMIRGQWGREERQCPKFPFQRGQPFKIQILFEPDQYKVAVNNENLCQYQHRVKNFSNIKCVRIDGDLSITEATVTMV